MRDELRAGKNFDTKDSPGAYKKMGLGTTRPLGKCEWRTVRTGWACWLALAAITLTASCGGDSNSTSTQPITVSLTQDPPPTLAVNATAKIAASVLNDPLHRGVIWTCSPLAACGTLNPTATGSGIATTYTAPSQRGNVTITATAAGSSLAMRSVTITITSLISVALSHAPPISMEAESTAPVAATVTGDTANGGVDWSCSPSASCGTFNPAHTASGAPTTYTAGSTAGSVTITATSTTDTTAFATASLNVFTVVGVVNLSGNYAFYVSGEDKNHNAYSLAGAVLLDGAGGVTGGELDANNAAGAISPEPGGDVITGGSYTLGTDGQGLLMLATNDANVGVGGTLTLALARVNNQHVLVTQFDGSATAGGSLDFQKFFPNVSGQVAGGYSFVVSGATGGGGLVEGGVFTSDGGGNLMNVTMDQDVAGIADLGVQSAGTYEPPDNYGRGRASFGGLTFTYYVVGVETLRMIETDGSRTAVGSAFGQGPLSSTASVASLSGNYVFTLNSGAAGATFAAAGSMSANSRGKITGFADVNETQATVSSAAFISNYILSTNGYGQIAITPGGTQDVAILGLYATDPQLNLNDPNNPNGGGGFLLADLDAKIVGAGLAVPQMTGSTVKGNFSAGFQSQSASGESDFVGSASATLSAPVSGTGSWNQLFGTGQSGAVPFSVTLTADPAHAGRFTAAVQFNGGATTNAFVMYQATSQLLMGAETDAQQPGVGMLQQQQ